MRQVCQARKAWQNASHHLACVSIHTTHVHQSVLLTSTIYTSVEVGFSVPDCLLAITIFSKVRATKKPPLEGDLYVSARRPLRNAPKRQAISRLEPGTPTAHMWTCLLLLPSGPDKVHRDILRWTQLSSLLNGRQTLKLLPGGRHQSCYSGLQVTGHR